MSNPVYLDEADHARVSAAVAKAESGTSGEIVTIVADRSDGYADVALAWAAFITLFALGVLATAPDFYLGLYERLTGGWIVEWTPRMILLLAAVVAALKFGGMVLIQLWDPLRFWLVPPRVKTNRVHAEAIRAFRIGADRRTQGRTGILIYLSIREHRAEIVADEAIATKVDPGVWGDAMEALLAEVSRGKIADGMIVAIDRIGVILAEHLPRADHDINELPDRLIEV